MASKSIRAVVFITALFIFLTPIYSAPGAKLIATNVFILMGFGFGLLWATAIWLINALRNGSPTLVFLLDGVRRSKLTPGSITKTQGDRDRIPGVAMLPYDGIDVPPFSVSDKSLAVVPNSAVEELSPDTTLIYAPAPPLEEPRLLKGIHSAYSDIAESHTWLSFSAGRKSKSEVRFSLLSSLITRVDTEMLMKQQRVINRSGGIVADSLEEARGGEASNFQRLRKLIHTKTKPSKLSGIKDVLTGKQDNMPSSKEDRPTQSGGMY